MLATLIAALLVSGMAALPNERGLTDKVSSSWGALEDSVGKLSGYPRAVARVPARRAPRRG